MATRLSERTMPVADLRPAASGGRGHLVRATEEVGLAAVGVGLTLVVLDGSWYWALARVLLLGAIVSRLMAVVRRPPLRPAALAPLGAAMVAVPAGAAVAVAYLAKSGWSVRSVGGLLTLAGGLVLLVVGTAVFVRSVTGWRRLAALPVGLLAAYGIGFPVAIAVAATNVPRAELGRDTPATFGLEAVDAVVPAADGVRLSGWYVPSRNGAAVVVLHGASSTRTAVLRQGVVLARHGYGVLLLDARGAGKSGGRGMNFGWYGERDVTAAVDWLQQRTDVDPGRIGALGESMGGEEAIGALPRLRAVVAEGATNRVAGDWNWLDDAYGLRGRFQQAVQAATYALTDVLTTADPPPTLRAAVSAAAPRPVLLIAAGEVPDETKAGEAIRSAAPDRVSLWVVGGAGHTGGLRAQPAEWERRVAAFFDASLGGPG